MVKIKHKIIVSVLALLCLKCVNLQALETLYWCEIGPTIGATYYSGDAKPEKVPDCFIFRNVQPNIGLQFRWKIDRRWSLCVKSQFDNLKFDLAHNLQDVQMLNSDVTAEYNFFRFGARQYDERVKPITPYIFLGVGFGCFGNEYKLASRAALYVPFGVGVKWKFASRCTLVAFWQHQLYFTDALEEPLSSGGSKYNDPSDLNGSNWFNRDLVGSLNVGLTFEFGKHKRPCPWCDE